MKLNIHSQTYTLAAKEVSPVINIIGNCLVINPNESGEYTTDIAVKLDDSGFKKVPTGFKVTTPPGETFRSIQFKNTGTAERTFHAIVVYGDAASYNLSVNGDLNIAKVSIDDSTPLKVAQQGSIAIDDTTPLFVTVQQMADVLSKLERIAVAAETTAGI